ncbi:hypothetical protein EDB81DRAFT_671014, partial [Dactylonectria macrodidyma]
FLVDLDLAIKEQREGTSEARVRPARAFMAIGALLDEQHSFMHNLGSFFWVLFWICIPSNGPDQGKAVVDMEELEKIKLSVGMRIDMRQGSR